MSLKKINIFGHYAKKRHPESFYEKKVEKRKEKIKTRINEFSFENSKKYKILYLPNTIKVWKSGFETRSFKLADIDTSNLQQEIQNYLNT